MTLEEINNLRELKNSSIRLNNELKALESSVNNGEVTWKELRDMSNESLKEASQDLISKQFTKIEETSIEYPTLISVSYTHLDVYKRQRPGG